MLSLDTIKRQVDREGKPWGVFGVIRDGKVFAASNGKTLEWGGGVGCVVDSPILICEINEDSTFARSVLGLRTQRAEWDHMKRFRDSEARRQAGMVAAYDDMAAEFKDRGRHILRPKISVPVRR